MNYTQEYEIDVDGIQKYVVKCKPVTQKSMKAMNEEIKSSPDAEDEITVKYGFSKFTLNGEEIDWNDVPLEIINEAVEQHPSFRTILNLGSE